MTYDEHRTALIKYLKAKVDICDWHAVRDACVDIEILEAREDEKEKRKSSSCPHPSERNCHEWGFGRGYRKWCGVCGSDIP